MLASCLAAVAAALLMLWWKSRPLRKRRRAPSYASDDVAAMVDAAFGDVDAPMRDDAQATQQIELAGVRGPEGSKQPLAIADAAQMADLRGFY